MKHYLWKKKTTIKRDGSEYRALKIPKLNRILQVGCSGAGFPALEKLKQADLCKFHNSQHYRDPDDSQPPPKDTKPSIWDGPTAFIQFSGSLKLKF